MSRMSARKLLRVLETGRSLNSVEKALIMIKFDNPGMLYEELEAMPIGQRDALLLDLRRRTFGEMFHSFVVCPTCSENLEFVFHSENIRATTESADRKPILDLLTDHFVIQFRLPNSRDLAEVINARSASEMRSLLVQRCVLQAARHQVLMSSEELPEDVVEKLANRMGECDPQAEILLDLVCPSCEYRWQVTFDIVSFLWSEISRKARRLLLDVHRLASSYGWREADILSMSEARRSMYLELIT